MAQGIVKSYDPNTGIGIVIDEETKEDLVIDKKILNKSIFITLRQGQRINYTKKQVDDKISIIDIKIGQDIY
tara:strand:+ start:2529 stop:2744 length:216 start_codon:yes stop_codon:yes gene_type:complete